jgi:lipopolysaccharide/colanic/teichoic acid biosynthesis glycosyltransferase
MTGQWQVSGRVQDSQRMLEEDLQYVDSWTWWLDVRILAATPRAMLQGTGQFPHAS